MDLLLPRERRWVLVAYLVVAVLDVVGDGFGPRILDVVAKPLLVPLLLLWLLLALGPTAPRLLVAGLGLAWLGDLALMLPGRAAFLIGLALFLGMQVCYLVGFARLGAPARLRERWWVPVGAVVLWAALNVALGPALGALRLPLALYSAALVAMATFSLGVSARVGTGGVLFLVSDLLIGLGAAGIEVPLHGVLVMATYTLAQLLITTGWAAARTPLGLLPEADTAAASRA